LRQQIEQLVQQGRLAEAIVRAWELVEFLRNTLGEEHPACRAAWQRWQELKESQQAAPEQEPGRGLQPLGQPASHETVQRHATVRYYRVMRPGGIYPLLVVLSTREIDASQLERQVEQNSQDALPVQAALPVEVEPILPGCPCYPARQSLDGKAELVQARFEVKAENKGKLDGARVALRQHGVAIAELPLEVHIRRPLLAILLGVLAMGVPLVLKVLGLSLEAQAEQQFAGWLGLLEKLLSCTQSLPVWGLGIALGVVALLLWLRSRPRRNTFWVVMEVPSASEPPEKKLQRAKHLLKQGEEQGFMRLEELLRQHPDYQQAWLLACRTHHAREDWPAAVQAFEHARALGSVSAAAWALGARSAAQDRRLPLALEWLEEGLRRADDPTIRVQILYNRACYLIRLGHLDHGMQALQEAFQAGFRDPTPYRSDPDLDPLRQRADFQTLLAHLPDHCPASKRTNHGDEKKRIDHG
jgi:tetratricopeptide (TPR) repeat protein